MSLVGYFLPFLLFLVYFHFALWGAFLAIFPIFLRFVGIFWGTPANYFADFGAIMAIFDHFWADFYFTFFDRKSRKPPKNKMRGCVAV